MSTHETGESISLAATIPLLWLSFIVLKIWGKEACSALIKKEKTPVEWLLLGVAISFVGSILDNSYWFVTWALFFFGEPAAVEWFKNGVFANIPFRQVAGIAAAYCHIKSAFKYFERKGADINECSKTHMIYSCVAGAALLVFLWSHKF